MKRNQLLFTAFVAAAMAFNSSSLFAQVKIGTNPTTIGATNNLEVEASTAGRKTSIDKTTGQVTIADGTQGAGKVLTSDVSGNATWQNLKSTAIYSFQQNSGVLINLPTSPAGTCNLLSCATDLNRTGVFTIANASSDVTIDVTGFYSVGSNNVAVQFVYYVAVDKTTPGVYELVDYYVVSHAGLNCSAGALNSKSLLKNLPPRTYNVKVFASAFNNTGTPATLGIGKEAFPGCGLNDYNNQNLIISVSQ